MTLVCPNVRHGSNVKPWASAGLGIFLALIAAVWMAVLILFSAVLLVQERRDKSDQARVGTGSTHSFVGPIGAWRPETSEQGQKYVHEQIEELEHRLNLLESFQHATSTTPSTQSKTDGVDIRASLKQLHPQDLSKKLGPQRQAVNVSQQKDYDSRTSPGPLVDPTILAQIRPKLEGDVRELCKGTGDVGDRAVLEHTDVWNEAKMGHPKIFCFSYTLKGSHATAVKNIGQTWGQRCDAYLAMSDETDQEVPSVDIKHDGPEAYDNMWQKVRAIWLYVHRHHGGEYDYFVSGGDDMFLIVENLRRYLLSEKIIRATEDGKQPIFLGRRFKPPGDQIFNSGGAGFVLNRAALDKLVEGLKGTQCRPNQVGFWEDVNIAYCLSLAGIQPYDTRDSLGRERFLPFTPGNHLAYRIPQNPDWYAKYSIGLKEGIDCCSSEALSFHYVKGDLMKKYHLLAHKLCPAEAGNDLPRNQ